MNQNIKGCLLCFLWVICSVVAEAQNKLANPGFEDTTIGSVNYVEASLAYGNKIKAIEGQRFQWRENSAYPFTFSLGKTYEISVFMTYSHEERQCVNCGTDETIYYTNIVPPKVTFYTRRGGNNYATKQTITQITGISTNWAEYSFAYTPTTHSDLAWFCYEMDAPATHPQDPIERNQSNFAIDNIRITTCDASPTITPSSLSHSIEDSINFYKKFTTNVADNSIIWQVKYPGNPVFNVVEDPYRYIFEQTGAIKLVPLFRCKNSSPIVKFTPDTVTINVTGGFDQNIKATLQGTTDNIFLPCEVYTQRPNGKYYYKGKTNEKGELKIKGLYQNDIIEVTSSEIPGGMRQGKFTVTQTASSTTPISIPLSPNYVDSGD